jgi:WG containing repeat
MKNLLFLLLLLCANTTFAQSEITKDMLKMPFYNGKQWGYSDTMQRIVIRPAYDSVGFFQHQRAVVRKNGKYGVIDFHGKILIPLQYDEITHYYYDVFILKQKNKIHYANKFGKNIKKPNRYSPEHQPWYAVDEIYNINHSGHYSGNIRQKISIVITDEKEHIIDTLDKFDNILFKDADTKNEALEVFSKKHANWLHSGVNYATKLEKKENKYITTMCYQSGPWCGAIENNNNNNYNYISCVMYKCKRYTIPNTYDSLQLYKMDMMQKPYLKTFKNGKIGLLLVDGTEYIPCKYDKIDYTTGDFIVTENDKMGLYFTKDVLKRSNMNENQIKYESITEFGGYYKIKTPTGRIGYWIKVRVGNSFRVLRMI